MSREEEICRYVSTTVPVMIKSKMNISLYSRWFTRFDLKLLISSRISGNGRNFWKDLLYKCDSVLFIIEVMQQSTDFVKLLSCLPSSLEARSRKVVEIHECYSCKQD